MKMTSTKTKSPKRCMIPDELQGHISDVLSLGLSAAQTTATVLSRVNGAPLNDVLASALAVARDQYTRRIRELELDLDESREECERLEDELQDLRNGLKNLLEESR